jgi:hypothetical protein
MRGRIFPKCFQACKSMNVVSIVKYHLCSTIFLSIFGEEAVRERITNGVDLVQPLRDFPGKRLYRMNQGHFLKQIHFIENVTSKNSEF